MKLNKNKSIYLLIFNIIWSILVVSLTVYLAYFVLTSLKQNIEKQDAKKFSENINYVFSIICFIFLIIIQCAVNVNNVLLNQVKSFGIIDYKLILLLSLLSLNLVTLIISLKSIKIFKKANFKIKRWKTFDCTIVGLMVAVSVILNLVCSYIPSLPLAASFNLKLIPIFFLAFITSFTKVLTAGIIASLFQIIMPNVYIINPLQYIFDYVIIFVAPSLMCFIDIKKTKNKSLNCAQWTCFIFFPMLLNYIAHVISGVVYFGEFAWNGTNVWAYSAILNLFNGLVDYLTAQILVPIICTSLFFIKERYGYR